MTETAVAEKVETEIVPEAPAPNLPAVRQERKPRTPRNVPITAGQYPAKIAAAIVAISKEMDHVRKRGENTFQHYFYPKWEDINEQLSPLLAEHGLILVQNEISRDLLEKSDKGSVLAIVYHFTIVNQDGEFWPPVEWTAIARLTDAKGTTDDKAASKCHTQAEKYFCLKQFKIRTKDYNKNDATPTLPKKDAREVYKKLQAEIDQAESAVELGVWGKDPTNIDRKATLPPDWQDIITLRYKEKLAELQGGPKVVWEDEPPENDDE